MTNFEKQFDFRNTVEYLQKRIWWILVIGVVGFVLVFAVLWLSQRERFGSTASYTCTEKLIILPKNTDEYSPEDCMEIMVSKDAIRPIAEELGAPYNYNGILGFMDWEWKDDYTYSVSLHAPRTYIADLPMDELLGKIVHSGIKAVEAEVELAVIEIVEEPYYEASASSEITILSTGIHSLQYTLVLVFVVVIILCCACAANAKIGSTKDIEKNLAVPVFAIKVDADIPAVSVTDALNEVYRVELTKKSNVCMLQIEKEKTFGKDAMLAKEELEKVGISVKGAILVK